MAYQAAKHGNFDQVLEILRREPPSICEHSDRGYNVFHQAGYWGKAKDIVAQLVAAGGLQSASALKARTDNGLTPAEYAKYKSHEETANALEEAVLSFEMHVIQLAKCDRFEDVLGLLNIEPTLMAARSKSMYTVLHFAGYFGTSPDIVNRLMKAGGLASLQALQVLQKDGLTPVDYAYHKGHSVTAEALKKHAEEYGSVHPVSPPSTATRVICIGDVHGQASALVTLWGKLRSILGEAELAAATVVFLGDYCDRGPQTREAIDFMLQLRDSRDEGKTCFICGNHDLGMAAFLGCLPTGHEYPELEWTRKPEYKTGFWKHPVAGGMHYQGRRWGGSFTYEAKSTFHSYGVPWDRDSPSLRDALIQAVPEAHKAFLRSLKWVHEENVTWSPKLVTCVHAGLISDIPAEPQLEALRHRDFAAKVLHDKGDPGRIASFSARTSVSPMHPDLKGKSLLVSGHHGAFFMEGERIINDRQGGNGPMEAVILPHGTVVSGC